MHGSDPSVVILAVVTVLLMAVENQGPKNSWGAADAPECGLAALSAFRTPKLILRVDGSNSIDSNNRSAHHGTRTAENDVQADCSSFWRVAMVCAGYVCGLQKRCIDGYGDKGGRWMVLEEGMP